MKQVAIEDARQSLEKLATLLETLRSAKRQPQFQNTWSEFLSAAHRIFSKLEQGAKVSNTSRAWFGKKVSERKIDPLLRYIHHARNSDWHGLDSLTQSTDFTLGPPRVERVADLGNRDRSSTGFTVRDEVFQDILEVVRLSPVVDRGVTYQPPSIHLGETISDPSPINIATLSFDYLQRMVMEARNL